MLLKNKKSNRNFAGSTAGTWSTAGSTAGVGAGSAAWNSAGSYAGRIAWSTTGFGAYAGLWARSFVWSSAGLLARFLDGLFSLFIALAFSHFGLPSSFFLAALFGRKQSQVSLRSNWLNFAFISCRLVLPLHHTIFSRNQSHLNMHNRWLYRRRYWLYRRSNWLNVAFLSSSLIFLLHRTLVTWDTVPGIGWFARWKPIRKRHSRWRTSSWRSLRRWNMLFERVNKRQQLY